MKGMEGMKSNHRGGTGMGSAACSSAFQHRRKSLGTTDEKRELNLESGGKRKS
jgi:hypothetical protein